MLAPTPPEKASPLFAGWRAGLARCTGATAFVALVNILFLSIATPNLKAFNRDMEWVDPGSRNTAVDGALFEGSCDKAKQLSLWLHLVINGLSTVLLVSGNYTQQVLTAPTRGEIDKAHSKHSWLNVGLLSYRNLRGISKRRVLAWAILALSSAPIHLLYNSVVALETTAYSYNYDTVRVNETSNVPKEYERLENEECISLYTRPFMTDRSDLFMVIPSNSENISYAGSGHDYIARTFETEWSWICSDALEDCDKESAKARVEDWKIFTEAADPIPIRYCLSKPVAESCRLTMSLPLLAIVIGCNILKLVGLGLTWVFLDQKPLLTLGDAVASFLEFPDPTTTNTHFLSIRTGRSIKGSDSNVWETQRCRWAYFVSPSKYMITMASSATVIIVASYLLHEGISQLTVRTTPSFAELWDKGFGSIDIGCLVTFHSKSPIRTSLLSNTPQLIISIIYTTVNGMWTAMMAGNEWNGYGLRRKGLRTSKPVGRQRGSYWLSLPFRYGLPLVAASTLLHWLISQSIFSVRLLIVVQGFLATIITQPGYSPIAIVFAIICGTAIIIVTVGLSLIPCKIAIPQIGTCSAVLSAACHPPEGDGDAALEEVMWGVVSEQGAEDCNGEERCCVTSWRVEAPIEGKVYK